MTRSIQRKIGGENFPGIQRQGIADQGPAQVRMLEQHHGIRQPHLGLPGFPLLAGQPQGEDEGSGEHSEGRNKHGGIRNMPDQIARGYGSQEGAQGVGSAEPAVIIVPFPFGSGVAKGILQGNGNENAGEARDQLGYVQGPQRRKKPRQGHGNPAAGHAKQHGQPVPEAVGDFAGGDGEEHGEKGVAGGKHPDIQGGRSQGGGIQRYGRPGQVENQLECDAKHHYVQEHIQETLLSLSFLHCNAAGRKGKIVIFYGFA
ncbi:hypothetical protein D3C75_777270 [compost metagenome]